VRSKYGKLLVAVRDAESRTRFLGYRVENIKLFAFAVSACMAGVAGALYVPQVGIINPSEFAPANSIEVVIWTAVGGRATLAGPIVGAVLVNGAKSYFTAALPDAWLFVLGGLFVFVTLFLPRGIVGTFGHGWTVLAERRHAARREKGIAPEPKSSGPAAFEPAPAE
jgi:urea transport system permease protein